MTKKLIPCGWAVFWLALVYASPEASDKLLQVEEKIYPVPEKTYAVPTPVEFHSAVSSKNLLGLTRQTLFSLPDPSSISSQPVTIKILAVRVAFAQESPDDPTTTGDGTFDFRPFDQFKAEEGHEIDPSPHGKAYFQSHLQALKIYWQAVSKGKLNIEYDVFPTPEDVVYEDSLTMDHYGQQRPDSGLGEFFKNTWERVELWTPSIDFSQYQAFVIFHAGSDRQSDLPFSATPTPKDLFTAFIVLGDSVSVDGGAFQIREGLILPETVSQDTRIGALNAVLAHEFGHQLGLVDLYKTYDVRTGKPSFTTQVGDFSLMDNNATDVGVELTDSQGRPFRGPAFSTLPVYPDAWSRAYLGFDIPVEIQNQADIPVRAAALLSDSTQIVKIPVNSQEYFLLENRSRELDDSTTHLKRDSTGVILGPAVQVAPGVGALTREYDFLLPGSGMLIWHVDEGAAYLDYDGDGLNNFLSNTLQGDKDRRFVGLVEADGIIDFGGDYYTGFGSQVDMYYQENNSALTPSTYPSSKSNTGANTHIKVTRIGRRDTLMLCDIGVDIFQAGWPQRFKPANNTSSLVSADVDADSIPELFLSSGNRIYAWKKDGSKLIDNSDLDTLYSFNGQKFATYPAAIFAETDAPIVGPPAIADLDGVGSLGQLVIAGTESGKVYIWKATDQDSDGRADTLENFPFDSPCSGFSHHVVIGDFLSDGDSLEILAPCSQGRVYYIKLADCCFPALRDAAAPSKGVALSGKSENYYVVREGTENQLSRETHASTFWTRSLPSDRNLPLVVGDLNRDGAEEVVVVSRSGYISVYDSTGTLLPGFPTNLGENIASKPVLGDIDGDGHLEVVFGGENKIWAFNYNGTVCTNFPIIVERAVPVGPLTSTPILVDISTGQRSDILAGSPGREVLAFTGTAEKLSGFPLSTAAPAISSGTVVNFEKPLGPDTERELAFAATDGFVYVWNINGSFTSSKDFWVMENFDSRHSNYFPSAKLPPPPVAGVDLMAPGKFYAYPNPTASQAIVRYYLNYDSDVELKFFDLSGNLIQAHQQKGHASTDNEFKWDCSGLASGVYLCRIQAKSQSRTQTEFCKIAVVK